MDIKPLETRYKGYRFRSRLEARWAVFFDALGIPWEYEKEGYDLALAKQVAAADGLDVNLPADLGWYLPDFWLPLQGTFVEIKPIEYSPGGCPVWPECVKLVALSIITDKPGLILCGTPGRLDDLHKFPAYVGFIPGDTPYVWCECPDCGMFGIQFDGRSARNKHKDDCKAMTGDEGYNYDSEKLQAAYKAARSARFEHGETDD